MSIAQTVSGKNNEYSWSAPREVVGGEILDTVLTQMNPFGRVAICGLISMYNATELPPGPKNIRAVLAMRLTVRGFIVLDFFDRSQEALRQLGSWYQQRKLRFREDIRTGGNAVFTAVLPELFSGGNFGKLILKL